MPSVHEEEILAMQRCRRGSKEAFEFFVRRYMKDAYFIALGLVGHREDALDLSQEAFVRAFRNIKQFSHSKAFFPWFYQILRNLCFSHLRKRRRERERYDNKSGQQEVSSNVADYFTPDAVAEISETKNRVWKAIGRLDEKHREVIILRHFQNLSYEQISQTLFCNKGTVTSRLYHARRKLKDMLDSEKGGGTK